MSRLPGVLAASIVLILIVAIVMFWPKGRPDASEYVNAARSSFRQGKTDDVLTICENGLQDYPNHPDLLSIAADAALRDNKPAVAADYLGRISISGDNPKLFRLLLMRAELLRKDGRFSDSLRQLKELRSIDPSDRSVRSQITGLYLTTGYREDGLAGLSAALMEGELTNKDLHILAKRGALALSRKEMLGYLEKHPDDVMVMHALATTAVLYDDHQLRRELLEKCYQLEPHSPVIKLELAEILLDDASPEAVKRTEGIIQSIRETEERYSLAWMLRARQLVRLNRTDQAIRCLGEAITRDPRRSEHWFLLAGLLKQRGLDGGALDATATLIRELDKIADAVNANPQNEDLFRGLVELLLQLDRQPEAIQWCRLAAQVHRGRSWPQDISVMIQQTARTRDAFGLKRMLQNEVFDYKTFPLPVKGDWLLTTRSDIQPKDVPPLFLEEAEARGIHFRYKSGAGEAAGPLRIQESTGGGIAAVDIDGDHWCDLYFSQGGEINKPDDSVIDRVCRNLRGQRFVDVTEQSGVHETSYSQGVAAGDLNNDGFPDLVIANAGRNTVCLNSGDGTFIQLQVPGDNGVWTASVAIADLNADSYPDIYDANYAGGPDVYTRVCVDGNHQHLCGPNVFPPEPDRVWISDGAGQFTESAAAMGMIDNTGRGLGVVCGDLNLDGQLDLYVANDTTANFLYQRNSEGDFTDTALALGVAFSNEGQALGSMGIAVGDADEDGRSDLFVTNYSMEMNNLYLQSEFRVFDDRAPGSPLGVESTAMVGFGTQFVDLEHDGDLDLVIVNGHVADFSYRKTPFRMPPQVFVNDGAGQFTAQKHTDGNSYLNRPVLGRALTRLDWNRDGRDDLAVSHLDHPAALLTNQSDSQQGWFRLRCVGLTADRDATGTTAHLKVGERKLMRQLTAGDGYMSSNERQLDFATGVNGNAGELTVRWLSGRTQQTASPDSGVFVIIEGREPLYSLPQ